MNERRKTADWPIVSALVMILVAGLGLYVGGYFATSTYHDGVAIGSKTSFRAFKHPLHAAIYVPLVKVESLIRGERIVATTPPVP